MLNPEIAWPSRGEVSLSHAFRPLAALRETTCDMLSAGMHLNVTP